ncbi:thiol-activated cytolysin family protein [Aequorivita sp. F47161]|uniref:Thiol-activated cytolysin family protein n=1 Tax=Aequorivita vitellina TaxID=2874475 RepID=A0A9X1U383_9FLAO|nr:thiol-activated cytolysin family protein [Aequorivita vitellina]MCG2419313.1 thiol-activated cytolysin family protein [Aequorivita vitellina]
MKAAASILKNHTIMCLFVMICGFTTSSFSQTGNDGNVYISNEITGDLLVATADGSVIESMDPNNLSLATWRINTDSQTGATLIMNVGNGKYLQANRSGNLTTGAANTESSSWEMDILERAEGYTYFELYNYSTDGYLNNAGGLNIGYIDEGASEAVWVCEAAYDVEQNDGQIGDGWEDNSPIEVNTTTVSTETNSNQNTGTAGTGNTNAGTIATSNPQINNDAGKINDYIRNGLQYDPRILLSVNNQGSIVPVQNETSSSESKKEGNNSVIVCRKSSYNLTSNVEDVAIMRPTNGIIWPGALVIANRSLAEGLPTPITSLTKAPTRITVDLPGLGSGASVLVNNPTNSTTQAAIDNLLEKWNSSPNYKVQPAVSTYTETMAYSNEQVAVKLGVNYSQMGLSVSTELGVKTSNSRKVFIVMYKQVFYTVNLDLPPNPADYFAPNVTIADVKNAVNSKAPPGYVQSVSYGRILMFRMETSASTKDIDVKGAFEYSSGAQTVGVDAAVQYKQILENSNISVITLGGNAEAAAQPVSAKNAGDLAKYIQGSNAVYSRINPGLPISYTVRFLKDHTVAKMGLTTDYSKEECEEFPNLFIRLKQDGAYVAKFTIDYTEDGNPKKWESGEKTAGWTKTVNLPYNAKNIQLNGVAATGLVWDPWGEIIKKTLNGNDVNKCYRAYGTTLGRHWDNKCE